MAQEANRRAIQVVAGISKRAHRALSRLVRRHVRVRGVVTVSPAPMYTRWELLGLRAMGLVPGIAGGSGEEGGDGGDGGAGAGEPAGTAGSEGGEPGGEGGRNGAAETFSREYVESLRKENAAARTKLKEHEDRGKTELERATSERDELRAKLTPIEQENMRLRVGLEKNLPASLVDRLRGSTKEELEKDADQLLADFGGAGGASAPRVPRGPSGRKGTDGGFDAAIRARARR